MTGLLTYFFKNADFQFTIGLWRQFDFGHQQRLRAQRQGCSDLLVRGLKVAFVAGRLLAEVVEQMLSLHDQWVGRVHGLGLAAHLFLGGMMEQRQQAQGEPASKPKTYLLLAARVDAN